MDIDCSIIKICFFERKLKPEIWIHSNSSIIDQTSLNAQPMIPSPPSSSPPTPTKEIVESYADLTRLRKRRNNSDNTNKNGKE